MFWWLAQNTLLAGLLAIAAGLACRFGRFSPAVRHAFWLVVLVKLITPPVVFYPLPGGAKAADWLLPSRSGEEPAAMAILTDSAPADGADLSSGSANLLPHEETADALAGQAGPEATEVEWPAEEARPAEAGPALEGANEAPDADFGPHALEIRSEPDFAGLRSWLTGAWGCGALLMCLLQATRLLRFRRLLRRTEAAPRALVELVEEIAARLQVAAPRVVLTSAPCSPMVCAIGRPRLIWPKSLLEPMTGDARRSVLIHELAHLRRRDHWVGWLELAASCGWWWNPIFWCVRRQLRENAELACDAWVVSLLPGGRRAYAQTLIEVSELLSWTAAPLPAVGMGASTRRTFERRLTMILRERVPCRMPLVGLASLGLLAVAALPGWSRGQAPSADAPAAFAPLAEFPAAPALNVAPIESEAAFENKAAPVEPINPSSSGEIVAQAAGNAPARADGTSANAHLHGESELEKLEARLAELAAEVRALRGQAEGARRDASGRPAIGILPKAVSRYAVPHGPSPAAVAVKLKADGAQHVIKLQLVSKQHVKLLLPEMLKMTRFEIDKAGVMELVEQKPQELELIAVHAGDGYVKFWDEKEKLYTVDAHVVDAKPGAARKLRHTVVIAKEMSLPPAAPRSVTQQGEAIETLTRARYKLPQAKAEALAAFLKEHAGSDVESKLEGETLIITASSEDQSRIGRFIELLTAPISAPRIPSAPTPIDPMRVPVPAGAIPPAPPAPAAPTATATSAVPQAALEGPGPAALPAPPAGEPPAPPLNPAERGAPLKGAKGF